MAMQGSGISNVDVVTDITGVTYTAAGQSIPLSFTYGTSTVTNYCSVNSDRTKVHIICTQNLSATYTKTYVTLKYTKTTDTGGA